MMMQIHQSQQSAAVVATIAFLIGNKINTDEMSIDEECRKALGDIILWDTPIIASKDTWPSRRKYSFMQIFSDPEEMLEMEN